MWTRLSYCVYFGLFVTTSCSRLIGAQSNAGNFTVDAGSYDCSPNGTLICLGDAHKFDGESNGTLAGSLSLIKEVDNVIVLNSHHRAGLAYYNKPVRMRDPSSRQSSSFKSSFSFTEYPESWNSTNHIAGDGLAFVISADNESIGSAASTLGFYGLYGNTSFKSVVVEFDNYLNTGDPYYDISDNHVSLDLNTITYLTAKNASDVNVSLGAPASTVYAWVEFTAATQQFQVRISHSSSRPVTPLLNYTLDLFGLVEEYMWVGFSGSTGGRSSYYYIGNWTFESSGIPPASSVPESQSKVGTIVAISVGVPFLVSAIVGIFLFIRFRRTNFKVAGKSTRWWTWGPLHKEDSGLHKQLSGISGGYRFSFHQLTVATGDFRADSKLGQGGFGSVYLGVLPNSEGTLRVAVKKIHREARQGEKEFMAEVSIISQLRHRNLIQLLGWCDEKGEYLIVYELMPNGSLDKALFRPDGERTGLSWAQRFNIITGTAAALDYLHQGWKQRVIHRDIKASNIMLDDQWNAKLGDFGLARLVDHERTPATTLVAGTYGYIAPEAAASGRFTDRTDVFAFGAVVLEVACGQKAFSMHKPQDEAVLVDWVWQRFSEGDLLSVVDSRLTDYDTQLMEVVLQIGLLCSHPDPLGRPLMRQVVQVLAGDAPVPWIPPSKPVAVFTTSKTGSHSTSNCVSNSSSAPDSQNASESPLLTMSSGSLKSLINTSVVETV